jgi:hypothetical protein
MVEESPQRGSPNEKAPNPLKIVWLLCAFIPSVIGLACLRSESGPIRPLLIFFDLVCSFVSAGCIMRGTMKEKSDEVLFAFILGGFFFLLNIAIVILVGCSQMRIAV